MNQEDKFKAMTEQLRLTNSDEQVGAYLNWIITSETARDYWTEKAKQALLKQTMPVTYSNGYTIEAVPKSTILSLLPLMKAAK